MIAKADHDFVTKTIFIRQDFISVSSDVTFERFDVTFAIISESALFRH
jgi:hypothetical protein